MSLLENQTIKSILFWIKNNNLENIFSFVLGLIVLIILERIVTWLIDLLNKKAYTLEEHEHERESIGLSHLVGRIERILFYLAAIAGKNVFAGATVGWLAFKGIHQWSRWSYSTRMENKLSEEDKKYIEELIKIKKWNLTPERYLELRDRNAFSVFLVGTGMSVASGGIAGAVYYFCLKFFDC